MGKRRSRNQRTINKTSRNLSFDLTFDVRVQSIRSSCPPPPSAPLDSSSCSLTIRPRVKSVLSYFFSTSPVLLSSTLPLPLADKTYCKFSSLGRLQLLLYARYSNLANKKPFLNRLSLIEILIFITLDSYETKGIGSYPEINPNVGLRGTVFWKIEGKIISVTRISKMGIFFFSWRVGWTF